MQTLWVWVPPSFMGVTGDQQCTHNSVSGCDECCAFSEWKEHWGPEAMGTSRWNSASQPAFQ